MSSASSRFRRDDGQLAHRSRDQQRRIVDRVLKPPLHQTVREAVTFSVITAYTRPFKQRSEVRLSRDVVPKQHQAIHDDLIEMRDKVIAHRDLDGPIADWGFVSQVQVVSYGAEVEINTLSPIITNEMAEEISSLCVTMVNLMQGRMKPLLGYLKQPLTAGHYVVSLDDNPVEWLQRVNS